MGFLGDVGNAFGGILGGLGSTMRGESTAVGPAYKPNEEPFKTDPRQGRYLAYLEGQAYGGAAPSVAETLIQSQTQKAGEQMAGAIGSTRGVQNPALLARQAAAINAEQVQQAAAQGAAIRAQEQQAAQQSYGDEMARQQQNLMNLEAMKANIASGQQSLEYQAAEGGRQRQSQFIGGLMGAGATLGAAASDIRVKENIAPGTAPARDYLDYQYKKMLDQAQPYTYDYKNKSDGQGKQIGVMAQDLEKSPLGQGMVETKDGKKQINANISTILAGQAMLNDRLNKIEGKNMKGNYLDAYESPAYVDDPNMPSFTLDEMMIGGKLPPQSTIPVGELRSNDSVYEGYSPRNMGNQYEGHRPVNTNQYPALENPPVKINAEPIQVTGNIPSTPAAQPMSTQEIDMRAKQAEALDARTKRDKAAYLNYLMDTYNKTSSTFSPSKVPGSSYRPQKIENFEQYRPMRRR